MSTLGASVVAAEEYDLLFKILLIGDSNVRKASILSTYVDSTSSVVGELGLVCCNLICFKRKEITFSRVAVCYLSRNHGQLTRIYMDS